MSRRLTLGLLSTVLALAAGLVAAPAAVAADRDCGDFASQRAAQIFFLKNGGPQQDPHRLDSDSDGVACESNPAPTYYGSTLPGKKKPEPKVKVVRSSASLSLAPATRISGESFRITVSVRPALSRPVAVQQKVQGRWKLLGTGRTGSAGKVSGAFVAPRGKTAYRAVLRTVEKGNTTYTAATSKAQVLQIQPQKVVLSFNRTSLEEGQSTRAQVRATPVRAQRPVALQLKTDGGWKTVRKGRFDRRGRATFSITPALGRDSYRAIALRHRGAAATTSRSTAVTVLDVTPPPAPYDLVATPGDGSVLLAWSRSVPRDFAHHEVWMRTAETEWSLVGTTASSGLEVSLLPNDVPHWFAVTSLDTSGNASQPSEEVSATPSAGDPGEEPGR